MTTKQGELVLIKSINNSIDIECMADPVISDSDKISLSETIRKYSKIIGTIGTVTKTESKYEYIIDGEYLLNHKDILFLSERIKLGIYLVEDKTNKELNNSIELIKQASTILNQLQDKNYQPNKGVK